MHVENIILHLVIQNKHTQFHTLEPTETPEWTRQRWCSKRLSHCCCVGSLWQSWLLPHKVNLSHNNKIHNTIKYTKFNTTGREGTRYYGIFDVDATWVSQPGMCSSMPATWDDHVVRLQNSSSDKAEIAIEKKHCANIHLLSGAGFAASYGSWRVLYCQRHSSTVYLAGPYQCWQTPPNFIVNGCRMYAGDLLLLISVAYFEVQYNFKLKWEIGRQGDRFCFCGYT